MKEILYHLAKKVAEKAKNVLCYQINPFEKFILL